MQGPQGSTPSPEQASAAKSQQKSSGKIPIISVLDGSSPAGPLIAASADGAAIRLDKLQAVAAGLGGQELSSYADQVWAMYAL